MLVPATHDMYISTATTHGVHMLATYDEHDSSYIMV